MHQYHRPSPVTASPANSPRTNPTRTNNPREGEPSSPRPGSERGDTGEGSDALMRGHDDDPSRDGVQKLSQVVQNYFTKAAHIILHSRVSLPPAFLKGTDVKRVNKWFNIELDETEITRHDLRMWKTSNATTNRPPVMVIEIYIDTEELTNNQSLAILDDQGKRWDVEEALAPSPGSSDGSKHGQDKAEVVIERWQIQLGEPSKELSKDLPVILPRVYKNSIVLFRSLFTFAKLLPAWGLAKKSSKPRSTFQTPKLKYRIIEGSQFTRSSKIDPLTTPLFEGCSTQGRRSAEVVEHYPFDPIDSPAGPFSVQVTYRLQSDFRIDDSEALLSSHFMGLDEQFFEPSLGRERAIKDLERRHLSQGAETGSLPQGRRGYIDNTDQGQAYGSMSTFHQVGPPTGSSPLSALRAARQRASESPPEPLQSRPTSGPRLAQASKSSLRSSDGNPAVGRRPSVSFQPFKTSTLSASPSHSEQTGISSPRGSLGRTSALSSLAEARIPSALAPQGAIPSRSSVSTPEQALPPSISSSPKPSVSRYSSSFGHRKAKLSVGGASKADEDNSSGKGSGTSSKPGSGILAEGGGTSSGSIQTDDDNISDFLKMLDQKKDLKSFRKPSDQSAVEASTRRTNAALGRFQRMRDSNAALSESMSSSLMMHRSSSSSSRQLSSVPPMVAGTSISTSSSPGKPISPHTPHTPAIPSRLSAHSVAEYSQHRMDGDGRPEEEPEEERHSRDREFWELSPGAIAIPTSPRPFHLGNRRASSAARLPRLEDDYNFATRSTSLGGADDRPHPSISTLLRLQGETAIAHPSVDQEERPFGPPPAAVDGGSSVPMARQLSTEETSSSQPSYRGGSCRPRIAHRVGGGRGHTPQGSLSSLDRASAGSVSSDQPGGSRGRYSLTRPASMLEEDEPLLFAMSDFGTSQQQHGKKSQDAGGDSGQSSRRGSRRGGHEGHSKGW
ncbi:MAG: hypothetical protein L6R41_003820 [Letrouitia leprolyta]|nr:MAG: hypothetical protein L6R41_003820 [Letrouitia leprolyta]